MLKKISANQEAEIVSKNDFPLIKSKIIAASKSNEWEEAHRDWSPIGAHDESSPLFTGKCELCNHVGLKLNIEIFNPDTKVHFFIGRRCAKRFFVFVGAETFEDSSVLLDMQEKRFHALNKIQNLLFAVLDTPTPRELMTFRISCKTYLEKCESPNDISSEKWKDFLFKLFGNNQDREKIDRIRNALFNPKAVPVKRVKLSSKKEQQKVGAWANVSKVKSRVNMTLAESEAYKNPHKISEEKH